MKKVDRNKLIIFVSLVVAICAMTLGFAAFSSTLTISSSATVTPNGEDFSVELSGSPTDIDVKEIGYSASSVGVTSGKLIIDGLNVSTSDIQFTEPGQKIIFDVYIHNVGKYDVYTKELKFNYLEETENFKRCTPIDGGGATLEYVEAACEAINQFAIGYNPMGNSYQYYTDFDFVLNNEIKQSGVGLLGIGIEYDSDGPRVDGPFLVEFGDVSLIVRSSNE